MNSNRVGFRIPHAPSLEYILCSSPIPNRSRSRGSQSSTLIATSASSPPNRLPEVPKFKTWFRFNILWSAVLHDVSLTFVYNTRHAVAKKFFGNRKLAIHFLTRFNNFTQCFFHFIMFIRKAYIKLIRSYKLFLHINLFKQLKEYF